MGSYRGRHDRIDEDALLEQIVSDLESLVVVAYEERDDRGGSVTDLEPHGAEIIKRIAGDLPEMCLALRLGYHNVEGGVGGSSGGRSD